MTVRFVSDAHIIIEFPAKDGGQIELSNTVTEEYSVPVYLTLTKVIIEDRPPEVKAEIESKGLVTGMIGFVRESDYNRDFYTKVCYGYYYRYLMTKI